MGGESHRVAVVDVGSNSTRLLIADVGTGGLSEVERQEAIATSAVRDASNGEAFVAELRERFALAARVLDGTEEARLTYTGATSDDPPAQPTLVVDIGGGSTELVVGAGSEIAFH